MEFSIKLDTDKSRCAIVYTEGLQTIILSNIRECSGSVVERLSRDREAAGSSLTGITALWP